jgi:Xaa-Pro dipeptidase
LNWHSLFEDHLRDVERGIAAALEVSADRGMPFDTVVFHAGRLATYHADDLEIPFRGHPHFLRFAPVPGPDHLLVYRAGRPLHLLHSLASDYWHAPAPELDAWVQQSLSLEEGPDPAAMFSQLAQRGRCAFIGCDLELADTLGIERSCVEPASLVAALDWERGVKTAYEIACMREAQRIAGLGHAALRDAICESRSEYELHLAYLAATRQLEAELPYPNIIAWDEAAAVLHYQHRRTRTPSPGRSFLVDAGARYNGYASDVTRTYCLDGDAPGASAFRQLLDGMEDLQQALVNEVGPGVGFVDLHRRAQSAIVRLLREVGVIRAGEGASRQEDLAGGFFPHGLGHHLGLQVHDVGGRQIEPGGSTREPPDDCPHLRTTRDLEPGQIITIEPGVYFIPTLLDAMRSGPDRALYDWKLVDALVPFGGIRIEDDVLVTAQGRENLTRAFVPGHKHAVAATTGSTGAGKSA